MLRTSRLAFAKNRHSPTVLRNVTAFPRAWIWRLHALGWRGAIELRQQSSELLLRGRDLL